MLHLIQYLKGYVCIKVWGYSPERFMNLCSNHDIFLWNIINCGDYYTMCITVNGFKRLRPIVRKTGTKVAIQKRSGLPFFVPKMKRRKIFLFGLLGSLIFWIWMSTFIWAVDLTGNYTITNDVFIDFLKANNVYVGMKHSKVDIETLEKKIREDFNIVTWTSAKINGTRLEIQIKENEVDTGNTDKTIKKNDNPDQLKNQYGSDLIAENDGVIVNMVTRKGVPQVAVQSEVKAGDILVAGSVPVFNEDLTIKRFQYYEADADIYIQRTFKDIEEIPLTYEQKEFTGEIKKEYFISILDKEMIFRIGKVKFENYDKVTDKKQVKLLDNFYLPIQYGSSYNREYVIKSNIYSKDEVKKLFSDKLSKLIVELEEKGVQIIRKNVTINKKNKKWTMDMDFQIVEKTGKNIPITPQVIDSEEDAHQANGENIDD